MYEIITLPADGYHEYPRRYLCFVLSIVERSFGYDEAISINSIDVTLRLMADNLDSFSEVDNFYLSLSMTIAILIAFILVVYRFILPEDVKDKLIRGIKANKLY